MSILATILNTLVVILAVLLIALILVQPTKSGGGFGSAFGGLGESVFGAQAMSHLSKLTVWCISIFFVLTLASAIIASRIQPSASGESKVIAASENGAKDTAPAASEAAKDEGAEGVVNPVTGAPSASADAAPVRNESTAQEPGN